MIRTLIVDDEPLAHDVIITYANEIEDIDIVGQCYSGTEALAFIKQQPVDLLLLDIEMPVLTGFDFLSVLQPQPQVIITSAYQEHALEGFERNVTDYLLKPFRFDRFLQALEKVRLRMQTTANMPQAGAQGGTPKEASSDTLFIKVDKKQVHITLAEVSCFEAYGNYVKVWRNQQAMLTPRTLTSFEQSLPSPPFIRVHKSAIINQTHIDYIEGDHLYLQDGKQVAIGKQFKHNLNLN